MPHQRKNLLKSLILSKAREELKREAARKAEEKKAALNKRIEQLGSLESMSQQELMVKSCHFKKLLTVSGGQPKICNGGLLRGLGAEPPALENFFIF